MSETLTVMIELKVVLDDEWKERQDSTDAAEKYETLIGKKAEAAFTEHYGLFVMNVSATPDTDDRLDEWAEQEAIERRNEELEMRKTKEDVGS